MALLKARLVGFYREVVTNQRLRGEVGWMTLHRVIELPLQILLLKMLVSYLGKEAYGEYNLITTAVILVSSLLFTPVFQSFLRNYHTAKADGSFRSTGMLILRWQLVATAGIMVVAGIVAWYLRGLVRLSALSIFFGACYMVVSWWWGISMGVLEILRKRKEVAICYLSWLAAQLVILFGIFRLGIRTSWAVLAGVAVCGVVFVIPSILPFIRDTLSGPHGGRSGLRAMILTFGLPLSVFEIFQWFQAFSDRYILAFFRGLEATGLYSAAFPVCGVPFLMLSNLLCNLITPIAYQRAKDVSDPRQLWSADKVLLGGLAMYILAGVPVLLVYAVWGRDILVILTRKDFVLPSVAILCLTGGRFFQCLDYLFRCVFSVHNKVGRLLWFRLAGALIAVPMFWFGIRAYGIMGAVVSMLIGTILYAVMVTLGPGGCFWLFRQARRAYVSTCRVSSI